MALDSDLIAIEPLCFVGALSVTAHARFTPAPGSLFPAGTHPLLVAAAGSPILMGHQELR